MTHDELRELIAQTVVDKMNYIIPKKAGLMIADAFLAAWDEMVHEITR